LQTRLAGAAIGAGDRGGFAIGSAAENGPATVGNAAAIGTGDTDANPGPLGRIQGAGENPGGAPTNLLDPTAQAATPPPAGVANNPAADRPTETGGGAVTNAVAAPEQGPSVGGDNTTLANPGPPAAPGDDVNPAFVQGNVEAPGGQPAAEPAGLTAAFEQPAGGGAGPGGETNAPNVAGEPGVPGVQPPADAANPANPADATQPAGGPAAADAQAATPDATAAQAAAGTNDNAGAPTVAAPAAADEGIEPPDTANDLGATRTPAGPAADNELRGAGVAPTPAQPQAAAGGLVPAPGAADPTQPGTAIEGADAAAAPEPIEVPATIRQVEAEENEAPDQPGAAPAAAAPRTPAPDAAATEPGTGIAAFALNTPNEIEPPTGAGRDESNNEPPSLMDALTARATEAFEQQQVDDRTNQPGDERTLTEQFIV
ncbi:MAG: hypothetical protein IH971_05530, partial [Candidatus Marinimicrobia bacterium]|nr:hypothetical protein [Candidatus Neomarinimicrobiota bacterium]